MRVLLSALALTMLLAGCSDDGSAASGDELPAGDIQLVRDLPAGISASETIMGGADPMNFVSGAPCTTPNNQCIEFPFTVNASRYPANVTAAQVEAIESYNGTDEPPFNVTAAPLVHIEASLTWSLPASDFDLYLMQNGADITGNMGVNDFSEAGGTSESIVWDLDTGDYVLVVVPWSVAQDTFTLTATFS